MRLVLKWGAGLVLALLPKISLGQPVTQSIDVGSSGESFCSGARYTTAALSALAPPYNTLRYAPSFNCDIPVPNGTCTVTVNLIEPRPGGSNPSINSGPGQRVFNLSISGGVNSGAASNGIDLFTLAGPLTPYTLALPAVTVTNGMLHLSLVGTAGNAVLSGIQVSCTPAPVFSVTLDADGVWHVHGSVRLDGFLETGPADQPTVMTVRKPDATTCTLDFSVNPVTCR